MEKLFIKACSQSLSNVQNIYFANPTIDISTQNERAFRFACWVGRLDVAQWLFLVKPTIDVSAYNEQAFRYACGGGHLSVAQWLFAVKPTIDISAQYEQAFRCACNRGHLSVAQWLFTLKPFLYVFRLNECNGSVKIWRVRSAEHARWQKRKCALWLRVQQTPANVFSKVPEDVSRYIVQMFL